MRSDEGGPPDPDLDRICGSSFLPAKGDVIHADKNRAYIVVHRWLWPRLLLAGAILSAVLRNVLFGIFKVDGPVFFLLTFLLAVAALVVLSWILVTRAAEL